MYIYGVFKGISDSTYGQLIGNGVSGPALYGNWEKAKQWQTQMGALYPYERYEIFRFKLDPNGVTATEVTYGDSMSPPVTSSELQVYSWSRPMYSDPADAA